jgi:hypothetical protein
LFVVQGGRCRRGHQNKIVAEENEGYHTDQRDPQVLDTRFPVPDHQLIPIALIVIVTAIAIIYEQYRNIVPTDPNRI